MLLGEGLDRVYDILGDVRSNPREFPRARIVDLLNEGCMVFRRFVEDEWFRATQDLIADQAVYTFPTQSMRAIRVAFEDVTLIPTTVQELQAFDDRWTTRKQPRPTRWTTQAQPHNKYRLYPTPQQNSSGTYTLQGDPNYAFPVGTPGVWPADNGIVARWQNEGGSFATFAADPNVIGWDADDGELMAVDAYRFNQENGILGVVLPTGVGNLTLWLVKIPQTVSDDLEELPIKLAYRMAPVFYVLWQTYEEEFEHHNPVLAAFYRDEFKALVERAREQASDPLPYMVHKLGYGSPFREEAPALPFAPTGLDDTGSPMNLGWPKTGYWE